MTMTMAQAEELLRPGRLLIGDEWIEAASGGEFVHINPSTGPPAPAHPARRPTGDRQGRPSRSCRAARLAFNAS
jgi:hypothetical protein